MGGLTFAFIILPCIGATVAGWRLHDWRLAGASAAGTLALIVLLYLLRLPFAVFALPVLVGLTLGALAVIPLLLYRPSASVWSRMMVAPGATFALSLVNIAILVERA